MAALRRLPRTRPPHRPGAPADAGAAALRLATAAQLNSRYTFDAFVIGNGNQFARQRRWRWQSGLRRPTTAVPVWRRGHGQDPPDARHRARGKAAPANGQHLLRFGGEIHQRNDHLAAQTTA